MRFYEDEVCVYVGGVGWRGGGKKEAVSHRFNHNLSGLLWTFHYEREGLARNRESLMGDLSECKFNVKIDFPNWIAMDCGGEGGPQGERGGIHVPEVPTGG